MNPGVLLLTGFITAVSAGFTVAAKPQWQSLFNGKDLTGWQVKITGSELGEDSRKTFRVAQGNLVVSYDGYSRLNNQFGHLFYQQKYSHYRLRLQYRFVGEQLADGPDWAYKNSGVMLHSQSPESMSLKQLFPVSIEGQFLGADAEQNRPTGNLCSPGTEVTLNGKVFKPHCVNSTSASFAGEQWVTAEFEVLGSDSIKHWINGDLVLSYQQITLDPTDKEASKLIAQGASTELSEGYIALQAESHPVEFRHIEIMVLEPK